LRRAQSHLDVLARDVVGAGMIDAVDATVVESLQLVLELGRAQRQSPIELERRRVHLRRQRPASSLELRHHEAIEVQHV